MVTVSLLTLNDGDSTSELDSHADTCDLCKNALVFPDQEENQCHQL